MRTNSFTKWRTNWSKFIKFFSPDKNILMEDNKVRRGFHGVYLLNCMNPRYRGHTYIGYTVNPERRIKQHNGGVDKGGAHKTSKKKPWEMILIVHGFPNDVIALQFEWAWQNPRTTRRLKHIQCTKSRKTKESHVAFSFRILSELLRVGPWNRLPLTIRWLIQGYQMEFDPCRQPPVHMPVAYGPLTADKPKKKEETAEDDLNIRAYQSNRCAQCSAKIKIEESTVHCPKPECTMIAHTICLAKAFIRHQHEDGIFCLPLEGKCPGCQEDVLWRDLVKPSGTMKQGDDIDDDDEPHWTQDLRQ